MSSDLTRSIVEASGFHQDPVYLRLKADRRQLPDRRSAERGGRRAGDVPLGSPLVSALETDSNRRLEP